MKKVVIYGLLIGLLTAFHFSSFAGEEVFSSDGKFSSWMTYYYLNAEPGKVTPAIMYYCDSALFDTKDARMPTAAFFAAIFKKDPGLMEQSFEEISSEGSDNSKIFLLNVLWLADTRRSRKLIDESRLNWKSEACQEILERMDKTLPDDILSTPVKDPARLDMLWATFIATGDSAPVKKIISTIQLSTTGHGMDIALGGAAKWSLTSNAYQHQRVYDICKEELKHAQAETRILLQEVIEDVDRQKAEEEKGKNQEK